jgi:hypothetical protein
MYALARPRYACKQVVPREIMEQVGSTAASMLSEGSLESLGAARASQPCAASSDQAEICPQRLVQLVSGGSKLMNGPTSTELMCRDYAFHGFIASQICRATIPACAHVLQAPNMLGYDMLKVKTTMQV